MRKKEKKVYVVLWKSTLKVGIFTEKRAISEWLGVNESTVHRNFNSGVWETDEFIVKIPEECILKSKRGGKREVNRE